MGLRLRERTAAKESQREELRRILQ